MFQIAFQNTVAIVAVAGGILMAGLLTGCGTSTSGLTWSRHQTMTGVSETGYPGGQPKDAESPALSSSTEQKYSDSGKPKVPKEEKAEKPAAK
jgi:hypothetical protein